MKNASTSKLARLAEFSQQQIPDLVKKIRYRIKPIDLRACYTLLGDCHLNIGVYEYFEDGKLSSFKQHLYTASQLKLAAIAIDPYQAFSSMEIFYSLFSDQREIISKMAKNETQLLKSCWDNPLQQSFFVHMWQLAILGDFEKLQAKIWQLTQHGRKKNRNNIDFFVLLIKGDKDELETLIHKDANIKSASFLLEDCMSFLGCMESKICWLNGIEVQIDHPLVPMALMPQKPLERYDEVYDFLAQDWQPQKLGIFDRLLGSFSG